MSKQLSDYRHQEQAIRAFYKYVCKEGWFSTLRNGRRYPINGFTYGYPVFGKGSQVYNAWCRLRTMRRSEIQRKWKNEESESLKLALKNTGVSEQLASSWIKAHPLVDLPKELVQATQLLLGIKRLIKKPKNQKQNEHRN